MKKGYFQISAEIDSEYFLHANFMNNSYVILNKDLHELFVNTENVNDIRQRNEKLYNLLVDNEFIKQDAYDELSFIEFKKKKEKFDSSLYQIVVNPTLDCNLSCWYCYEQRQKGSVISDKVIRAIKNKITLQDDNYPFKVLKLSFF